MTIPADLAGLWQDTVGAAEPLRQFAGNKMLYGQFADFTVDAAAKRLNIDIKFSGVSSPIWDVVYGDGDNCYGVWGQGASNRMYLEGGSTGSLHIGSNARLLIPSITGTTADGRLQLMRLAAHCAYDGNRILVNWAINTGSTVYLYEINGSGQLELLLEGNTTPAVYDKVS